MILQPTEVADDAPNTSIIDAEANFDLVIEQNAVQGDESFRGSKRRGTLFKEFDPKDIEG